MRILYGVVGEGMGHAIRSKVVIDHLIHSEGHEVEVVVSGRAHAVLSDFFPEVHRIWGLSMTFEDSRFKVWRSLLDNLSEALDSGFPENVRQYFEITEDFRPHCVISDFESWSYLFGVRHALPVVCIDNIQMVSRCRHDREFVRRYRKEYELQKNFVKTKTPGSSHYYIPTFFYPETRKGRTTLVPPILRQEVLDAEPTDGDHVLVYQTTTSSEDLPEVLAELDQRFVVYGYRRDIDGPVTEGNVTYRPFDEHGFVEDLASARAVIANGGFTLMGETVHLRKPMLCIPLVSQFEQLLNAHYLEELGYGFSMDRLDVPTIRHFLDQLDTYRGNLATYNPQDNTRLFDLLDERLDHIAAGVE
jgi:uncharacterized protein (TIGR00661 family)